MAMVPMWVALGLIAICSATEPSASFWARPSIDAWSTVVLISPAAGGVGRADRASLDGGLLGGGSLGGAVVIIW